LEEIYIHQKNPHHLNFAYPRAPCIFTTQNTWALMAINGAGPTQSPIISENKNNKYAAFKKKKKEKKKRKRKGKA
jgi:hypothetical protein